MAGKMYTLLPCPGMNVSSPTVTGPNGLPLTTTARTPGHV